MDGDHDELEGIKQAFFSIRINLYILISGNLIIGRSAAATIDFAFAVIEKLQGTKQKELIQKQIYY